MTMTYEQMVQALNTPAVKAYFNEMMAVAKATGVDYNNFSSIAQHHDVTDNPTFPEPSAEVAKILNDLGPVLGTVEGKKAALTVVPALVNHLKAECYIDLVSGIKGDATRNIRGTKDDEFPIKTIKSLSDKGEEYTQTCSSSANYCTGKNGVEKNDDGSVTTWTILSENTLNTLRDYFEFKVTECKTGFAGIVTNLDGDIATYLHAAETELFGQATLHSEL